jgi:hypothetical protein
MCKAAEVKHSQQLADHLFLLMDGSFIAVSAFGVNNPARNVGEIVNRLLECE